MIINFYNKFSIIVKEFPTIFFFSMAKQFRSNIKSPIQKISNKKAINRKTKKIELQSIQNSSNRRENTYQKPAFFEKKRIQCLKLPTKVLANYFSNLSLNYMAILNVTSAQLKKKRRNRQLQRPKITHSQVFQFLQCNKWCFLKILSLMIKDRYPSIHEMLQINYMQKFVIENNLGSLMYGLKELRSYEHMTNDDEWLHIKPVQLKCFYIISLLLVGVSKLSQLFKQIDYHTINLQNDTTVDNLFEKIVQKLLCETKLLTPIIFNQLIQKWNIIIDCINNQISNGDEQKTQSKAKKWILKLRAPQSLQNIKMILGIANKKQESIAKICQQNFVQAQLKQNQINDINKENRFLPSQSDQFQGQHSQILFQQEEYLNYFFCESMAMNPVIQKIIQQKDICIFCKEAKQQPTLKKISVKLAEKRFNYGKRYTRKRNGKNQIKINEDKMEKLSSSQQTLQMQSNIYLQEANSTEFNNMNSCQPSSHHHQSSARQIAQNQINNLQIDSQGVQKLKKLPYHSIPHTNREVDDLIKQLINKDMAIARSIANHIYHTLKVCKIHLDNDQEQYFEILE